MRQASGRRIFPYFMINLSYPVFQYWPLEIPTPKLWLNWIVIKEFLRRNRKRFLITYFLHMNSIKEIKSQKLLNQCFFKHSIIRTTNAHKQSAGLWEHWRNAWSGWFHTHDMCTWNALKIRLCYIVFIGKFSSKKALVAQESNREKEIVVNWEAY